MKKFVFELESVLRLREHEERERQLDLARVEREREALERRLREVHESARAEREALRADLSRGGSVKVSDVRARSAAGMHLLVVAQRLAVELAGSMERCRASRSKLAEATAARRAVDLLRERRYEAWRREALKREQAELDDLSMSMGRAARSTQATRSTYGGFGSSGVGAVGGGRGDDGVFGPGGAR